MRRLARAVGLLGMALGLVLPSIPAAHAASELTVTFTDQATLTGCDGLGYPVITPVTTTDPLAGELCTFTIDASGQTCAYTEVSAKKMPPVSAGLCTFAVTGTVKGYCGLSAGEGTGKINLGYYGQLYVFTIAWAAVGGTLVLTGTATKLTGGQTGPVATVVETFRPNPVLTPAGGSCLTSTATIFTIMGEATATVA